MKNHNSLTKVLALAASVMMASFPAHAADKEAAPKPAVELGAPYNDNATLQRDMPLPVWGWSKPGTKITVEFSGQKKSATAGDDGKWMLKLDPLKANAEPQELTVMRARVRNAR